tara:strand:- start:2179 stop:3318 length:1140 start_codon:yes stop_codon:yes gene_type:complete
MIKKIYYWSPFFSDIATIKAVLNSVISISKFAKNDLKPTLINVIGEWDSYKDIILKNNIEVIDLKLSKNFKKKKIRGFFQSRYYQIKIFILAFFPLISILKRNKPDIFVLHLVTSLPLFLNYLFNFKSKIILRISGLPKLNIFRKLFWKIAIKKVDIITTPTIATKNHLQKILNKKEIYLLRDPIIYVKEINKKQINYKNHKSESNIYVAIGRLTKQKNFLFLLNCFKKIIDINKNNYLYILGNGENYRKLEEFIKKNNLEKNIFLEGYKENIYKYLNKARAFILSSLWEDPGFVLVEASYSNTTIISSDCENGPKEILDENKNGFLFKSNDYNSFIETFDRFEKTNSKEISIKKINAKKMSKNFSLFSHYCELNKILN